MSSEYPQNDHILDCYVLSKHPVSFMWHSPHLEVNDLPHTVGMSLRPCYDSCKTRTGTRHKAHPLGPEEYLLSE